MSTHIDPTARLFKLATEHDNQQAIEALNESHKSIEWYYSLPQEQFLQLKPQLQSALNSLRKLYEYNELTQKSLMQNTATIPVEIFARRYYRWLRGEQVPQHVLDQMKTTQYEYLTMLFEEWCTNIGSATRPVWVVDDRGEHIYLLPSLHCRDMVSVKEQVGFVTQAPDGERFVPSGGAINDNISKINLLQTDDQKEYAMKKLFDTTISVNGVKQDAISIWKKAWDDAIVYFDNAFGLTAIDKNKNIADKPSEVKPKKETGYNGSISDLF